mgnify:CR=1 FL=1
MSARLQGKVALISGAGTGIGAAAAQLFAIEGARVMLCGRRREPIEAMAKLIRQQGGEADWVQADVTDESQVMKLFARLDQHFGRLDVLVNNAGMLETQMPLEQMDLARWQRVFATNVFGSFLCAREAIRRMSTAHGGQGGSIVNLSSAAARLGAPGEYIDYAAAKGAIDSMTLGLAKEVAAEGIRVNAVRPGVIDTEIHASGGEPARVARVSRSVPMGRGGLAEEVAEAILWLAGEQASYTSGALLDVSGGR